MTTTTRRPRIAVPAEAVRTPEQILDGETVVAGHVWVTCHWCGGAGTYPSSMIPAGMCRFYCWRNRTPETYGRRPTPVEKFVKRAQASDRRAYRERVRWEMERPEREARLAAAHAEREARMAVERAERQHREAIEAMYRQSDARIRAERSHLGSVGERITLPLLVEAVVPFEGTAYGAPWKRQTRYLVRFRDANDNALVWWTTNTGGIQRDTVVRLTATVKSHDSYKGEAQTVVQRAKAA